MKDKEPKISISLERDEDNNIYHASLDCRYLRMIATGQGSNRITALLNLSVAVMDTLTFMFDREVTKRRPKTKEQPSGQRAAEALDEYLQDPSVARPVEEFEKDLISEDLLNRNEADNTQ